MRRTNTHNRNRKKHNQVYINVNIIRGKGDELFFEGAAEIVGLEEFTAAVTPGAVPFGRIVNNTIVGLGGEFTDDRIDRVNSIDPNADEEILRIVDDYQDIGIEVGENADPTILNNVIVNFAEGLERHAHRGRLGQALVDIRTV